MGKVAWVLSGEGAKGAFQALVIKHLDEDGLRPDFLVGVSSGALNAVGYSLLGADGLISFWRQIKSIKDVFSFNWRFLWESGVYTTAPLRKKLDKLRDLKFKMPVYFPLTYARTGATNFSTMSGARMASRINRDTIIDSVTIPGVVRSDSGFVDGGAMLLCPLAKAIELGATEIHVILGRHPYQPKVDFKPNRFLSFLAYGNRFLELLMFSVIRADIENVARINNKVKMSAGFVDKKDITLHIYYPVSPLYDSLAFNKVQTMLDKPSAIGYIGGSEIEFRTA